MLLRKIVLCCILAACSVCGMFFNWIPSFIPCIAIGVLSFIALTLFT